MVHRLTAAARFFFVASFISQTIVFAQYPCVYLHSRWYNGLMLLALPTLVLWVVLLRKDHKQLQNLWMVWGSYMWTMLIPMVGLIYGGLREKLASDHFFGPNVLMMTTCGSPAIALLLLSTANDASEDKVALFTEICCNTILDLFDDIEILDMLLSQNVSTFHLPAALEVAILVCVCISLVLSTLEMAEKKHDQACGLLAWFVVLKYSDEDDQLHHLWIVWGVYVVFLLIPMVAIIYGGLRESLNSKHFFGPNILMVTTCGSPAIALILLTTAQDVAEDDDEDSIGLFTQLCGNIVLDLFDDIEILDILLFQDENFPSSLQLSIVVFVCISLLLSTLDMALLIIRLVVWLMYNHNASIFIAKNLIIIVISIINMIRLIGKKCCQ